jgi:hypothetical protein
LCVCVCVCVCVSVNECVFVCVPHARACAFMCPEHLCVRMGLRPLGADVRANRGAAALRRKGVPPRATRPVLLSSALISAFRRGEPPGRIPRG